MSSPNSVTVSQISDVTTVEITTQGPQGPSGSISGLTFDVSAKVDGSILYYDSTSGNFKADTTTTKLTLVDGGNF
jgi:hypothetical protein|tara:strand:- start:3739 stop:3963 length:225 start_codon:yes stop_codon:yes gene_type:complete